jgi:hypothetical protein
VSKFLVLGLKFFLSREYKLATVNHTIFMNLPQSLQPLAHLEHLQNLVPTVLTKTAAAQNRKETEFANHLLLQFKMCHNQLPALLFTQDQDMQDWQKQVIDCLFVRKGFLVKYFYSDHRQPDIQVAVVLNIPDGCVMDDH